MSEWHISKTSKQANKQDKTNTCCGLIFLLTFTGFRVILGASGENTLGSIVPALRPLRSEFVERLGVLHSFIGDCRAFIFVIQRGAGAEAGLRVRFFRLYEECFVRPASHLSIV